MRSRAPTCALLRRQVFAKAPEVMTTQVLASNTKTPQVRELEKINTGVTRTKRHYPAYGSTTARMAA
jgi:hypothetical protein